jgi:RNA polymerase sigma-70 factor (ECF subfamily)
MMLWARRGSGVQDKTYHDVENEHVQRLRDIRMNDESALLQAARKLDKKALAAIFDLYAPIIYNYVLRLCHDAVESDNIVGDVFAKLLEQFAAGQGPLTNLRTYLFSMAYHSVVDGARHNHRLAPLEVVIDTPNKSRTDSMVIEVEERHMLEAFRSILDNELSDIQRDVIILRFIEDFSLRETAAIVGKKVNHVKVIQNRGIAKLRKLSGTRFWPDSKKQQET